MIELALENSIAARIGWTLLHSVWQGMALAALLVFALNLVARGRHDLRHALAAVALVLWLLAPVATFLTQPGLPVAGELHATVAQELPAGAEGLRAEWSGEASAARPANDPQWDATLWLAILGVSRGTALAGLIPYAALGWLAIATLLCLRLLGGVMLAQGLARSGTPLTALAPRLDALAGRLGITRSVRLLESKRVDVPTALGFLRPAVLLPASAISGLTPAQLELILAHELAHIRRSDYLVSMLQGLAEALLFYHPLTWWLSGLLRLEREKVCDDLAVEATGLRPVELAEALTRLEAGRPAPAPLLSARTRLLSRIRRLLQPARPGEHARKPTVVQGLVAVPVLAAASLGLWFALVSPAASAQPATDPMSWSVVIDPGHGGMDPGAGSGGPITEAELSLTVALKLRALLEEQGVGVVMTRDDDTLPGATVLEAIETRAAMATPEHELFVSIHAAAATDNPHPNGLTSWIARSVGEGEEGAARHAASRLLAESIHGRLIAATGALDRSIQRADFALLWRVQHIPAVLVELGFLSNPREAALLASEDYQDVIAAAMAEGILAYLHGQPAQD